MPGFENNRVYQKIFHSYTLKYSAPDGTERLNTVTGTEYKLTGLSPSCNYSLTLRTELPEAEGGVGGFSQTPLHFFTGIYNVQMAPKPNFGGPNPKCLSASVIGALFVYWFGMLFGKIKAMI